MGEKGFLKILFTDRVFLVLDEIEMVININEFWIVFTHIQKPKFFSQLWSSMKIEHRGVFYVRL